MKIQLHVGTEADISFNLRHFWPMKSFRRPTLQRKTNCHFKISGAIQTKRKSFFNYRLSTITHANLILVLNEGEIVQRGKHEQLLENDGLYKELWDQQSNAVNQIEVGEHGEDAILN